MTDSFNSVVSSVALLGGLINGHVNEEVLTLTGFAVLRLNVMLLHPSGPNVHLKEDVLCRLSLRRSSCGVAEQPAKKELRWASGKILLPSRDKEVEREEAQMQGVKCSRDRPESGLSLAAASAFLH